MNPNFRKQIGSLRDMNKMLRLLLKESCFRFKFHLICSSFLLITLHDKRVKGINIATKKTE